MQRVAFVTCENLPQLTADDAFAISPLKKRGIEVVPAVWNDPDVEWQRFEAIVLRSCWDYHEQSQQFLEWISLMAQLPVRVFNKPSIVTWNTDKSYLRDLSKCGAVLPTTIWLETGTPADLRSLLITNGLEKAVVKPTVSATAKDTWLTSPADAINQQEAFEALLRSGSVMIQSFLDEILEIGEWSLMFFEKRFSHGVIKFPKAGDFRVQSDFGGTAQLKNPPHSVVRAAESLVQSIEEPLLYARVDGVDINGELTLLELELIEPELFLRLDSRAAERFAESVAAWTSAR